MDVECGKCGKMVSSDSVKVDAVNQWYVCNGCLQEEKAEKERKYKHEKMTERSNMVSKVKIVCAHCNYNYLYDTWKKYPKECPYCGNKQPDYK